MGVAHDREVARMESAHGAHFDEKGEVRPLADDLAIEAVDKLMGGCALESAPPAPAGGAAASAGGDGERGDAPAALVLTFSSVAETAEERKARREAEKKAAAGGKGGRRSTARGSIRKMTKRAQGVEIEEGDDDAILSQTDLHSSDVEASVVNVDGQPLDARGALAVGKDAAPAKRALHVEIRKKPDVADQKSLELRTRALSRSLEGAAASHTLALRLPSLAVVDPDSASGFVRNVVGRVRLLRYADPDTGAPKETIWLVGTDCPVKPHAS